MIAQQQKGMEQDKGKYHGELACLEYIVGFTAVGMGAAWVDFMIHRMDVVYGLRGMRQAG